MVTESKKFVFDLRKNPQQEPFIFSSVKYTAFIGGIGSGKTTAGCVKAILHCRPGCNGVIVAPTYPMIRDVVQRTFFEILDMAGAKYEYLKSEEIVILRGASVFFRSSDNPNRLRGLNLSWAYLDEAALMSELTWKIILGRLRVGNASAWIATTPAGFNWVWKWWAKEKSDKYEMFKGRTTENKALTAEYVHDVVAAYTGEFATQELEGEFVAFEGLVYSEFRTAKHTYKPKAIPANWRRYVVIDYGYVNPFAALWIAVDGDNRMWVYRELYRSNVLITENARRVKELSDPETITDGYDDWDSDDHAVMQSVNLKFNMHPADKGDVVTGIARVKARLAQRGDGTYGLNISEDCPFTIKEAGMYRWREKKDEADGKEEPLPYANHAWDAIRYLCNALDKEDQEVMSVFERLRRQERLPRVEPHNARPGMVNITAQREGRR